MKSEINLIAAAKDAGKLSVLALAIFSGTCALAQTSGAGNADGQQSTVVLVPVLDVTPSTVAAQDQIAVVPETDTLVQDSFFQVLGPYLGFGVGESRASIDNDRIVDGMQNNGLTETSIFDQNRSTGYKVFGGYQVNRYFALEAGIFDLGKFGYNAHTTPEGTLDGQLRLRGLNLDLVGTLPITDRLSAIGRVGVDYAQTRDSFPGTGAVLVSDQTPSQHATNPKIGLGLQYALTEKLAFRLEAERYRANDAVGNRGDIDLFSAGLIYRFGDVPPPQPAPVAKVAATEYIAVVIPPQAAAAAPVQVPIRFEKRTFSATDLFTFDSAELRMPQTNLDDIATVLKNNPDVDNVVISGYTDRIGSDKYNQKLSERRADSVKNYLIGKGVATDRLRSEGHGKSNPVVVCTDKKQSALITCLEPNRRVEVEQIVVETKVN